MTRRDVKQVNALTSVGMIDPEMQATAQAAREFGRIQVHQQFRALAKELGMPEECTLPPTEPRRIPRWYAESAGDHDLAALIAMSPIERRARMAVLRPGDYARGGLLIGSVA